MDTWSVLFIAFLMLGISGIIYMISYKNENMNRFYIIGTLTYLSFAIATLFLGLIMINNYDDGERYYDVGMIVVDNFIGSIFFGIIIFGISTGHKKINESNQKEQSKNDKPNNLEINGTESNTNPKDNESVLVEYWNSFINSIKKEWNSSIYKTINFPIKFPIKFLLILISTVIFLGMVFFQRDGINSIFNQIKAALSNDSSFFYDNEGNFEWIGITAIIAILSLIATSFYNNKKFKADLVSKSRIEWIQNVRQLMSEFLTKSRHVTILCVRTVEENQVKNNLPINVDNNNIDERKNKLIEDANKHLIDMFQLKNLLLLNFSNNKGNSKILQKINDISSKIDGYCKQINNDNYNLSISYDDIDQLTEIARDYFKEEWEIAKKGK